MKHVLFVIDDTFKRDTFSSYTADNVEIWNGSAWTETSNVSQNSYQVGGTGTTPSGLKFGGSQSNADIAFTEEWTGPGAPIGAWSTGGNMNTARNNLASMGTRDAALAAA